MPSAYGYGRNEAMYYQYGGVPRHYEYNWTGVPQGSQRSAESRSLGEDGDYLEVEADIKARLHQGISGYETSPVAMSMESGTRSVLHSGIEQTRVYDAPLGFFGSLSRNEQRLALFAGLGIAGWLLWKKYGKK